MNDEYEQSVKIPNDVEAVDRDTSKFNADNNPRKVKMVKETSMARTKAKYAEYRKWARRKLENNDKKIDAYHQRIVEGGLTRDTIDSLNKKIYRLSKKNETLKIIGKSSRSYTFAKLKTTRPIKVLSFVVDKLRDMFDYIRNNDYEEDYDEDYNEENEDLLNINQEEVSRMIDENLSYPKSETNLADEIKNDGKGLYSLKKDQIIQDNLSVGDQAASEPYSYTDNSSENNVESDSNESDINDLYSVARGDTEYTDIPVTGVAEPVPAPEPTPLDYNEFDENSPQLNINPIVEAVNASEAETKDDVEMDQEPATDMEMDTNDMDDKNDEDLVSKSTPDELEEEFANITDAYNEAMKNQQKYQEQINQKSLEAANGAKSAETAREKVVQRLNALKQRIAEIENDNKKAAEAIAKYDEDISRNSRREREELKRAEQLDKLLGNTVTNSQNTGLGHSK